MSAHQFARRSKTTGPLLRMTAFVSAAMTFSLQTPAAGPPALSLEHDPVPTLCALLDGGVTEWCASGPRHVGPVTTPTVQFRLQINHTGSLTSEYRVLHDCGSMRFGLSSNAPMRSIRRQQWQWFSITLSDQRDRVWQSFAQWACEAQGDSVSAP